MSFFSRMAARQKLSLWTTSTIKFNAISSFFFACEKHSLLFKVSVGVYLNYFVVELLCVVGQVKFFSILSKISLQTKRIHQQLNNEIWQR
jgi:hypothetical protein